MQEFERQHDPNAEALIPGRRIGERIRQETNADYAHFYGASERDLFRALYLTERDGCVPGDLVGDDLLLDIHALFYQVFDGIREELLTSDDRDPLMHVVIDPSYEDTTTAVLCTDRQMLLLYWRKAWHFYWDDEEAMAQELGELYLEAAERLTPDDPGQGDHGT